MKYVEGADYWVYSLEFPNMASPSVAVSNGDGTFTIYLNSRCSPEARAAGLRHELEHLEGEHFFRDDLELWELESVVVGRFALSERRPYRPSGRDIPLYRSTGEFLEHFLRNASPESLRLLRAAGLLPDGGKDAVERQS